MIDVKVTGVPDVLSMLQTWEEPVLSQRATRAVKAGAVVFKSTVRSEAAQVSRRLAQSTSVRAARRDRPAYIVTFRPKVAFFRHWILLGTRNYRGRRGMVANPILGRVADRLSGQAFDAVERDLTRTETP